MFRNVAAHVRSVDPGLSSPLLWHCRRGINLPLLARSAERSISAVENRDVVVAVSFAGCVGQEDYDGGREEDLRKETQLRRRD
jgi:hypothetical protein